MSGVWQSDDSPALCQTCTTRSTYTEAKLSLGTHTKNYTLLSANPYTRNRNLAA